jgi:hypothetical protein
VSWKSQEEKARIITLARAMLDGSARDGEPTELARLALEHAQCWPARVDCHGAVHGECALPDAHPGPCKKSRGT